ncbi:MAG: response regulator [Candidatus Omnitrophota bacterium]|nr:response regulator [Candidatus Omnitrophota bacterium]
MKKSILILEKCSILKNMQKEKPRLLVIDDEAEQCASLKNYFCRRNFQVFTTASGEEALTLIKDNRPDLVLLDMKLLGDMDGGDVLRELRRVDKNTQVAVITGDVLSEEKIREISALGIVDLVYKPVVFEVLEGIIRKALEKSYPQQVRFEQTEAKPEAAELSFRRISHELANVTSDIATKCELYLLDTEEGLYKGKSEKERLDEAIKVIKAMSKLTERLTGLIKTIASLAKKEL